MVGKLAEIFGMEFEEFEVKSALTRLTRLHLVHSQIKSRSVRYYLKPEVEQTIKAEWKDSRDLETQVLEEWSATVQGCHGLSPDHMELLKADLKSFLTRVFKENGADCIKLTGLATPSEVERVVGKAQEDGLASLPPREAEFEAVRRRELPQFLLSTDEHRLRYLDQLSQAMLVWFALGVDPDLSTLLVNNYAGGVALLDTNLALHLLGMDGPDLEAATAALLKCTRSLGYNPALSLQTTDEIVTTIKILLKDFLASKDSPAPAYMEQVLSVPSYKEDLYKAYYRAFLDEYRRTGRKLSKEAFALTLQAPVDALRTKYQIEIYVEHDEWVEGQKELLRERTQKVKEASARRARGAKEDQVAEHDAYNLLVVHRERSSNPPHRFVDATAWFITEDRTLLLADQWCRRPSELPLVVHAESWLNMARLCLPRHQDVSATFARLLAEPYLRTARIPTHVADKIGGYLALESKYAPEVATRMLQDKMLTENLQRIPLAEVQAELDKAAARVAAEETERRAHAEEVADAHKRLADQRAEEAAILEAQVAHATAEQERLRRENAHIENRLSVLEAKEQERQNDRHAWERKQLRRRKVGGNALLVLTILGFAFTVRYWKAWPVLDRVLLAAGVAILLAVAAMIVDGAMGFSLAVAKWSRWVLANLLIIALGYGIAHLFSDKSLSDTITLLSTVASLLANPMSGLYIPSATAPAEPATSDAA